MKRFLIIFAVAMLLLSCTKGHDEMVVTMQQRDYLPEPTRTEVADTVEGLMVLGPQLNNPYKLSTMQQARLQLLEDDASLDIPELTTSHYYVRFAPQNEDELYSLLQDTTVYFFDFPLDREVISGTYYHDPAIVDSLPTYQYASIPKAKWDSDYANTTISYTIIENLFIPEESDDFFAGDNNGNSGGDWIVPPIDDNIEPWFPRDSTGFIPIPDPTDPPIEIPVNGINGGSSNTNTASDTDIINMLVDKAHIIAGLESEDSGIQVSASWMPSGRITAFDNVVGGPVPIVGAKVLVHRWFTTVSTYTNDNGYFFCNRDFKRPVNYYIKWERDRWDIREGWFGQAYFNGPKLKGQWIQYIDGGKSLAYATIHRAAFRVFYGYAASLNRPTCYKTKFAYQHRSGSASGRYWLELGLGILPDIQIFGFDSAGNRFPTDYIFGITCHELGHAAHWTNATLNFIDAGLTGSLNFIESWADCVQYILTNLEYEQLGVLDLLHKPWSATTLYGSFSGYKPNYVNKQAWFMLDPSEENYDSIITYTPVFIDLIDDFNQANYKYNQPTGMNLPLYWSSCVPVDSLQYSVGLIEQLVLSSASLNGVRNKLTARENLMVNPNTLENIEAIMSFFSQYEK